MQTPTVGLHVEAGDTPRNLTSFVGSDGETKVGITIGHGARLIGTTSDLRAFLSVAVDLVDDAVAAESAVEEAAASVADGIAACRLALVQGRHWLDEQQRSDGKILCHCNAWVDEGDAVEGTCGSTHCLVAEAVERSAV